MLAVGTARDGSSNRAQFGSTRVDSVRLGSIESNWEFLFDKSSRAGVLFGSMLDSTRLDGLISSKKWGFAFQTSAFYMTFPLWLYLNQLVK